MSYRGAWIVLISVCLTGLACASREAGPSGGSNAITITINPSIVHQTMTGWAVPAINTVLDFMPVLPFVDTMLDQAANDVGVNQIMIGFGSGVENPSDACQRQYLNREISEGVFTDTCAYNAVNDNDDPNVVNPNGFHFLLLDWQIDHLVLPLKRRVEARGEKLRVDVQYVDFEASKDEHYRSPDEYAELMLVVFDHIYDKYGFVPDGLDAMVEPDQVPGWGATALGRAIARAGERLASAGYTPEFIGPSSVNKARAVPYFDAMMAVPGVSRYLKALSWHCYAHFGWDAAPAIGIRAVEAGVRTFMTECWNSSNTYEMLHHELKTSQNSSWQLGIIHGTNGFYDVDARAGQVTLRPRAKYFRQYFKYIRAGARRIDATSSNPAFDPVAFVNADGTNVVVVTAKHGGTFAIANLVPSTYGTFYTTGPNSQTVSRFDVKASSQTITAGQNAVATIPDAGVITIYGERTR